MIVSCSLNTSVANLFSQTGFCDCLGVCEDISGSSIGNLQGQKINPFLLLVNVKINLSREEVGHSASEKRAESTFSFFKGRELIKFCPSLVS